VTRQFTLGKHERMTGRTAIKKLFSEGESLYIHPFRVYFLATGQPSPAKRQEKDNNLQFGVAVSARNFKRAVDRNRIKRLTREAYRLQKNELQETLIKSKIWLNTFFVYTSRDIEDFNVIKLKVAVALKQLLNLIRK